MNAHADPTELLSRVLPDLPGTRVLLVGPDGPGASRVAHGGRRPEIVVVHHFEAGAFFDEDGLGSAMRCDFGFLPVAGDLPFDLAALWLPKGRAALELQLAATARLLRPEGLLVLCGPKRGGIKSARSLVAKCVGRVLDVRAGAHCQAIVSRLEHGCPVDAVDAVHAVHAVDEDERLVEVEAWGRRFAFTTLPGVFAHGRLDEGTARLLESFEPGAFSRALDWGCGGGVLGAALQLARPESELRLVDSSAAAVEAARRTLTSLGLGPDAVRAADGWRGVDGDFDLIVTNPPFHQGVATDRKTTEAFLDGARGRLRPGGRLVLVANVFLPWPERLSRSFEQVSVLSRDSRWQVVEARV